MSELEKIRELREIINTDRQRKLEDYLKEEGYSVVASVSEAKFLYDKKMEDNEKIDLIETMLLVHKIASEKRKHCKDGKLPPYEVYLQIREECPYSKKINKGDFNDYYKAVCYLYYELVAPRNNAKALDCCIILEKIGVNNDQMYKMLDLLKTGGISPKQLALIVSDAPNYDLLKLCSEFIKSFKTNMIKDIIENFEYNEKNDGALENYLVYQLMQKEMWKSCNTGKYTVIIGASPFFINKYLMDNNTIGYKTIFVFDKDYKARLFSQVYLKLTGGNLLFMDYRRFNGYCNQCDIGSVVIFGNRVNESEDIHNLLFNIIGSHFNDVMIFGNDYDLLNSKGKWHKAIIQNDIALYSILLLPEISNAPSPKRKTMVYFCNSGFPNISVNRYTAKKDGRIQYFDKDYSEIIIGQDWFREDASNLRTNFRMSSISEPSRNRKTATRYEFSREIMVDYSKSFSSNSYRVKATMILCDWERETETKVYNTAKSRKFESDITEQWIAEEYPYEKVVKNNNEISIQHELVETFGKIYKAKEISLKSYEYINYELEERYPAKVIDDLRKIIDDNFHYLMMSQLTANNVKDAFDVYYADKDDSTEIRVLELLEALLRKAVREGYAESNELTYELSEYRKEDKHFREIRNNLTYKQFSKAKYRKFYRYLIDNYSKNSNIYLAILMKLTLGLENNIICGLKWKDFSKVKINGMSFGTLFICRQVVNDGKEYKTFIKKESYRKVPLNSIILKLLIEKKNELLVKSGLQEDDIKEMPIIFGKTHNRTSINMCQPTNIQKEVKLLVEKLNICEPELISVPDNNKGTIETDLGYYKGDLLRNNYSHHMRNSISANEDEVYYLLGLQCTTTYAIHYYDFENDYSQYLLYLKQEKLLELLQEEKI